MELRQLEHFVAVAQEMHFTRAARRINIVQSALSSSISALEEELGVKLFHRTTRQVRLTAAGEALYERAGITLSSVRQARRAVAAVRELQSGSLMIGTVQSLPAFLDLPELLADFHAMHPAIEVRLRQGSRVDLPGLVLSGQLDLAFAPKMDLPRRLVGRIVVDEPLVMVCAPGHRLAREAEVSLGALAGEDFVDFQPGWGTRSLIDRTWEGHEPRHVMFEVSDLDTQLALVARGLGVALVPRRNVDRQNASLRTVPLTGVAARWQMILIHRSEGDAAVDAFLGLPALGQ